MLIFCLKNFLLHARLGSVSICCYYKNWTKTTILSDPSKFKLLCPLYLHTTHLLFDKWYCEFNHLGSSYVFFEYDCYFGETSSLFFFVNLPFSIQRSRHFSGEFSLSFHLLSYPYFGTLLSMWSSLLIFVTTLYWIIIFSHDLFLLFSISSRPK